MGTETDIKTIGSEVEVLADEMADITTIHSFKIELVSTCVLLAMEITDDEKFKEWGYRWLLNKDRCPAKAMEIKDDIHNRSEQFPDFSIVSALSFTALASSYLYSYTYEWVGGVPKKNQIDNVTLIGTIFSAITNIGKAASKQSKELDIPYIALERAILY